MEPRDYVIRLIRRMVQFLARIYRMLDEKQFELAERTVTEKLIAWTGLPDDLVDLGDAALVGHMIQIKALEGEQLVIVARLFYLKGIARRDGGDPITAQRYFQCAHVLMMQVSADELEKDVLTMFQSLRLDLNDKTQGVDL